MNNSNNETNLNNLFNNNQSPTNNDNNTSQNNNSEIKNKNNDLGALFGTTLNNSNEQTTSTNNELSNQTTSTNNELSNQTTNPSNELSNTQNTNKSEQSNQNTMNNDSNNNEVSNNNKNINDYDLEEAFAKTNYESFLKSKFNIGAFLIAGAYYFYRKMYLYGIIVMIADAFSFKYYYIGIIIRLILAFITNKVYLFFIRNEIKKIKHDNLVVDQTVLKQMCEKKGGTSVSSGVISIFIQIFVSIVVAISLAIGSLEFDLFGLLVGTNTSGKYTGILNYDSKIEIKDKLTITVPPRFKDDTGASISEYSYKYNTGNGTFDECKVELGSIKNFSDANDLLSQMHDYNKNNGNSEPTPVTVKQINGLTWYTFSMNDGFGQTDYYGTNIDNKLYLLQYDYQEDSDSLCPTYKEPILNSIKKK